MRKTMLLAACLGTFSGASAAQDIDQQRNTDGLRPFIGIGASTGGDKLITVQLVPVSGSGPTYQEDVKSGGGLDLRLGLSKRLGQLPWTLQVAGAYHNDQVNGVRGEKTRFRRIPVEATLLWHATDRTRVGFGVRKALNPVFRAEGGTCSLGGGLTVDCSGEAKLKSKAGYIVELEYAVTPGWSLKGRYVYESYRVSSVTPLWEQLGFVEVGQRFEADHFGIQSIWYLP